jgi:hypothetical protein
MALPNVVSALRRELAAARAEIADRLEIIIDGEADRRIPGERGLGHLDEEGTWEYVLPIKKQLERIDALLGPPPSRVAAEFDIERHFHGAH